ncbi:iron ABC transporter substrate-binding protein [Nocardioides sp. AE5]|uniref:iron ABC transporter substrate-binding protein n=1 Tax=Nocardioides sp. AE5 TaxID=2962573 RepID=UPI0028816C67|nr:iron ABC transporter substrate-binding protein [Nocardioides sp. AE5]MDT0200319.1 iron ABC transporter substrate-binding protein [Nocardioides sp. AE5]
MRFTTLRRIGIATVAAGLFTTTLAACGEDAAPAGKEGGIERSADETLVLYSGRNEELVGPLIEQFTQETGIEVDVRYAGTTEQAALLLEEGANSPADVFLSQDAGALGLLSDAGMLVDLPEEITGAVMGDYSSQDGSWVGLTARARVIAYNGDKYDESEVPDNVAALTGPEWKGKVAFPPGNASFQSFVTGFRVAEGDDAAAAWLKGMVDNDFQSFEKNGDVLTAVDEGAVDLGLINHYYLYALIAEVGEENVKAKLKFPKAGDPGALVNVTGAAVLSTHPDAIALVKFLVSKTGQEYFVNETHEYPVVEGINPPADLPALADLKGPLEDLSDLDDLEKSIQMIQDAGMS